MAASTEVVDNLKAALEARGYEVTVNDGTTRIKGKPCNTEKKLI